jgi:hypothetical protein
VRASSFDDFTHNASGTIGIAGCDRRRDRNVQRYVVWFWVHITSFAERFINDGLHPDEHGVVRQGQHLAMQLPIGFKECCAIPSCRGSFECRCGCCQKGLRLRPPSESRAAGGLWLDRESQIAELLELDLAVIRIEPPSNELWV